VFVQPAIDLRRIGLVRGNLYSRFKNKWFLLSYALTHKLIGSADSIQTLHSYSVFNIGEVKIAYPKQITNVQSNCGFLIHLRNQCRDPHKASRHRGQLGFRSSHGPWSPQSFSDSQILYFNGWI
jgi:hypothetical protein